MANEVDNALDVLVKNIVETINKQNNSYDISFISVIKAVNTNGTYTVLDRTGSERNVKCVVPTLDLSVGKNVWIKIPSGNLNKMHIYGVV